MQDCDTCLRHYTCDGDGEYCNYQYADAEEQGEFWQDYLQDNNENLNYEEDENE